MSTTENEKETAATAEPKDDESDVELEGMDLEGLDEQGDDDDDGDNNDDDKASNADEVVTAAAPADEEEEDDKTINKLETEDHDEMEAARKEQKELMAAESAKVDEDEAPDNSVESQLQYLLAKSEVFAHFLAGKYISYHNGTM
jgi:hypothetical protein